MNAVTKPPKVNPIAPIVIRGFRSGETAIAIVDAADGAALSRYAWHLGTDGYARRRATKVERLGGAPFYIAMHRQILGVHLKKGRAGDVEVDHLNRKRLDNRRCNLQMVERPENATNRIGTGLSSQAGVSLFKRTGRWCAYITLRGRRKWLGYFSSEQEAVVARKAAERRYYGRELG